jgi:hypothetical protein
MAAGLERDLAFLHLLNNLVFPDRGVVAARDDSLRGGARRDQRNC